MTTLSDGEPPAQALPLKCDSCGFFPGDRTGAVRWYQAARAVGDHPAGIRLRLCDDCIGDLPAGLLEQTTPTADEAAVDWLLRLRFLRRRHDFDTALALANAEAGGACPHPAECRHGTCVHAACEHRVTCQGLPA